MRTPQEIRKEIKALKKLKPTGMFKFKTARSIALAIQELEYRYDDTSDEWNELTDSQRDIIHCARAWKEGDSSHKPSEGWGNLVMPGTKEKVKADEKS